jgi:hypothetical protein
MDYRVYLPHYIDNPNRDDLTPHELLEVHNRISKEIDNLKASQNALNQEQIALLRRYYAIEPEDETHE